MPTFFRHRESQRATTPNVQGEREHGPAGETNDETKTGQTDKQHNKEEAKPTGKRTGGRLAQKLQTTRGVSLRTDEISEKTTANTGPEKTASSHSDNNRSTTSSEDVAPSPKRQNQKRTPPTALAPQKKSARNRQSALTNAFGNAVPINTNERNNENNEEQKAFRFEIDSPPDKPKSEYPSLKSLIQEMGFTEKTPQYQACVKFIEAISSKHSAKQADVVE